jgi:hypothetical protein
VNVSWARPKRAVKTNDTNGRKDEGDRAGKKGTKEAKGKMKRDDGD